jgi:hypothetical protein
MHHVHEWELSLNVCASTVTRASTHDDGSNVVFAIISIFVCGCESVFNDAGHVERFDSVVLHGEEIQRVPILAAVIRSASSEKHLI